MNGMTTLNERRRRLRDVLVERGPESVDMSYWGRVGARYFRLDDMLGDLPCGTVGCLAGWGAHVAGDDLGPFERGYEGSNLAVLVDYYGLPSRAPFHVSMWEEVGSRALTNGYDDLATVWAARGLAGDRGYVHEIEHRAIVGYLTELIEEES